MVHCCLKKNLGNGLHLIGTTLCAFRETIHKVNLWKNSKDVHKKEIDDAINNLNDKIMEIKKERNEVKSNVEGINVGQNEKVMKKCRYYNTGYCKYKQKCKFIHSNETCKNQQCDGKGCSKRHPKACKWNEREGVVIVINSVTMHMVQKLLKMK